MKMKKNLFLCGTLLVLTLSFSITAQAQEEPYGIGDLEIVNDVDIVLPTWFEDLAIGVVALAPVAVAITQLIKIVGARLGVLPDGYGGYILFGVVGALVLLAVYAEIFQTEEQVAEILTAVHRLATWLLSGLTALGWYAVGKRAQIIRRVDWREDS